MSQYKKMTREERAKVRNERIKDLQSDLQKAVENLSSQKDWMKALDVTRNLRGYSFNNTMLLYQQAALRGFEPSIIMGMKGKARELPDGGTEIERPGWNVNGRRVKKGESALQVLAPRFKSQDPEDPDRKKELVGWMYLNVYDIAQTEGEPFVTVSDFTKRLEGVAPSKLIGGLEAAVAQRHGYIVCYETVPGASNGFTTLPEISKVVIDAELSEAQTAKTLAHELAHLELDHFNRYPRYGEPGSRDRELAEVEAESVSYILCKEAGLDGGSYSFGYVAGWSQGNTQVVTEVGKAVRRVAFDLMEAPTLDWVLHPTAEIDMAPEVGEPTIEPSSLPSLEISIDF